MRPDFEDAPFRPVAPPADGLRTAFVAARRRRAAKAGTAGAAGLLVAVLTLTTLGSGGQPTLMQEPLPPAHGGPVVEGHLSEATVAPTPPVDQRAPGTTGARVAGGTAVQPGAQGAAVPPPGPATSPQARPQTGKAPAVSGPMTRSVTYGYTGGGNLACPANKRSEGGRVLCTDVSAYADGTGKTEITANICNVDTASDAVTYPTARELDVAIVRDGHEIWRWSTGRRFADVPHELDIPVGQCLTWTTGWNQVDARGVAAPKGDYSFVADFDAEQLPAADRRATYSLTYY